jgi:hypothetical protein
MPGELGKYGPNTPGLMVHEDPGAEATSPGAALPGMLASVPRTTKSCNKHQALSPSHGLAPATLTPVAPYGAPPAPGTSVVDTTTSH